MSYFLCRCLVPSYLRLKAGQAWGRLCPVVQLGAFRLQKLLQRGLQILEGVGGRMRGTK